jgi:hypothetical protein
MGACTISSYPKIMIMNCHAGEVIFTEQPDPLALCDLNGETVFLQWKAQYESCVWSTTEVRTMNFKLHPNNNFLHTEIDKMVNITVNNDRDSCNSDRTHINVTLSIHLNEYVLEHVPYIFINVVRFIAGDRKEQRSDNLYLEANRNCFSTTTVTGKQSIDNNTSVLKLNATTMEASKPSPSSVKSYASCVLHCNRSLISYSVMGVFVMTVLAVLKL